jgi:hypothetical protein
MRLSPNHRRAVLPLLALLFVIATCSSPTLAQQG